MLICRLRIYPMPGAPPAEGNFSSRESARFRIIVQNDFSNTCTRVCARTQTHAQMHDLLANPFNAATQWGSVSNAALDFFFLHGKTGSTLLVLQSLFGCLKNIFPHVRMNSNV